MYEIFLVEFLESSKSCRDELYSSCFLRPRWVEFQDPHIGLTSMSIGKIRWSTSSREASALSKRMSQVATITETNFSISFQYSSRPLISIRPEGLASGTPICKTVALTGSVRLGVVRSMRRRIRISGACERRHPQCGSPKFEQPLSNADRDLPGSMTNCQLVL